jgi:hypothetical protein
VAGIVNANEYCHCPTSRSLLRGHPTVPD